jgi:hypothetical protein
MTNQPSEEQIQQAVMDWARAVQGQKRELRWLHHPANGGKRSKAVAGKMWAAGVRAGVADLHLPVARSGFHSLWIELKTETGRQTQEQKEFEAFVTAEGNAYWLARSSTEAIYVIEAYLEGKMK